ncbi:MAG: HAMP domain-containing histidine kinase [Bacteroidales bacterium]|nr:HAMP domain-containing histidine kinase [Bacteroidales bacterium]
MNKYIKNPRIRWYILIFGFCIVFLSFFQINKMISQLRREEQKKVELWAKAISRKAEIVKHTKEFYDKMTQDENVKLQQFVEAYKVIMSQPVDADLTCSKLNFYSKIIVDNKTIPVIITDEFNNIQLSQNVVIPKNQHVLVGKLYKEFSKNKPFEYSVYGMKFKLYYTESKAYSDIKNVLEDFTNSFLSEITDNTVFVPVIITDTSKTHILAYGNINKNKLTKENISSTIASMEKFNNPIRISLPNKQNGLIFFERSKMITLLQYYPILYILLFILFGYLFFQIFKAMKASEQNSVWVGMSKETAHQLGTPISSLVAWVEYLKMNPENESICKEITKDIKRLDMIAQRFSQIGSNPTLKNQDLIAVIDSAIAYLSLRTPKNVKFDIRIPQDRAIIIPLNQSLLEWTFENLSKNAIDAMEGQGKITIEMEEDEQQVYIDVTDTGKGLSKKQFKQIFQPGYTTKTRGWGLGLSLVKRIIEEYHKGKIYVKQSYLGKGTTFRIVLNKHL